MERRIRYLEYDIDLREEGRLARRAVTGHVESQPVGCGLGLHTIAEGTNPTVLIRPGLGHLTPAAVSLPDFQRDGYVLAADAASQIQHVGRNAVCEGSRGGQGEGRAEAS